MADARIFCHASMLLKRNDIPYPGTSGSMAFCGCGHHHRHRKCPGNCYANLPNVEAWTLGFSGEAQIDSYVNVTDKQK